jgi:hypothetical protein
VLAQAAGLALLSALSPTALLIAAVYLGSARAGLTSLSYLVGAVLMSVVMGVVVLFAQLATYEWKDRAGRGAGGRRVHHGL